MTSTRGARRVALVAVCVGVLAGLFASAGDARAATCSGTLGIALSERGREYPLLSFRCDVPIGDNFDGWLFTVAFSNRSATTLKEPMLGKAWLEDSVGGCGTVSPPGGDTSRSYVQCTGLTDTADSLVVAPGTTITGTPWDAEQDMPVCSDTAEVTVYGPREEPLTTFPLVSTCPSGWKGQQLLTVVVRGGGTVTGNGIWCRGTCTYLYRSGASVSLTAAPDKGAAFGGWVDGCRGTTARCSVTLDEDLEVAATFKGGPAPIGKVGPAVDSPAFVKGTGAATTLGCHGPTGSKCTIIAALTTTERLQGTRVVAVSASRTRTTKRVVTLAKRTYTIAAGAQKTVSLPLNATGRSLLQRFGTLPVRLTASVTNASKPFVFYTSPLTFTKAR